MNDDKVFKPTEIQETPLPGQEDTNMMFSQKQSGDTFKPIETPDQGLPKRRIATDIISSGFNSITRKVKSRFAFTPAGLINDRAGDTIADTRGVRSTTQFLNDQIVMNTLLSTTSTDFISVPNTDFTIEVERAVEILFNIFCYLRVGSGDMAATGAVAEAALFDSFLDGIAIGTLSTPGFHEGAVVRTQGISIAAILTVNPGIHNYKMIFRATSGTAFISAAVVNYVILGK